MQPRLKVLIGIAMILAITALGACVASANRYSVTEQNIRIVWAPGSKLIFSSAVANVACAVTLEGSLHSRTFPKTARLLIGYITRAAVGTAECTGGSAIALQATLPWHIQYDSFTGILPTPSGAKVRLINASFQATVTIFGIAIRCLYRSTEANPLVGRAETDAGGTIVNFRADEAFEVPYSEGPGSCPASIAPRGNASLRRLGTTASVILRLI